MDPAPFEILLVEDSPTDEYLARCALAQSPFANTLRVVTDGVAALEYLRREGSYREAPRPDLILLDLNLPRKDGREVLSEIKNDDELKRIPVVVLSTSLSKADIDGAYALHANCYVTKSVDFQDFARKMSVVQQFWFRVVHLPTLSPGGG